MVPEEGATLNLPSHGRAHLDLIPMMHLWSEQRPYDNHVDVWPKCSHNKLCMCRCMTCMRMEAGGSLGVPLVRVRIGHPYNHSTSFFKHANHCILCSPTMTKETATMQGGWIPGISTTQTSTSLLEVQNRHLQIKIDGLQEQLQDATPYLWTVSMP